MILLCSSKMEGIFACHWNVLVLSFISLVVKLFSSIFCFFPHLVVNWQKSERKTSLCAAEFNSAAISAITTVSMWFTLSLVHTFCRIL